MLIWIGHVFPGATLPFGMLDQNSRGILKITNIRTVGMAKAVADVSGENQGGFGSDFSNITGFSHMHDSG